MDEIVNAAAEQFSGVVAVDRGGERVYRLVRGDAHRAHRVPNTIETAFGLASGSKGWTALAVLALVEQGKVALDEPVRGIVGDDLPNLDSHVTLRHLLTHSAGIEDYLDESEDWDVTDYVLPVPVHTLISAQAFVPLLAPLAQRDEPGSGFRYSNAGYVILALIIERLTGQLFHDVVADLVLAPAGMTHSSYMRLDELPAGAALGYLADEGDRVNTLHLPVRGNGDGGAFSTADDLHIFWRAFVSGDIVSREMVAQIVTPHWDVPEEGMQYGMGFWLAGTRIVLEGYDPGVSFRSSHDPQTDTTVTVIANTSDGAWPMIAAVEESLGWI